MDQHYRDLVVGQGSKYKSTCKSLKNLYTEWINITSSQEGNEYKHALYIQVFFYLVVLQIIVCVILFWELLFQNLHIYTFQNP